MKKFLAAAFMMFILGLGTYVSAENIAGKILLWPANRIADALDVFSISIGAGMSVRAELMATELCKVGAGSGYSAGLVKAHHRQYGIGARNGWYTALLAGQQEKLENIGLVGSVKSYQQDFAGVPEPTDVVYDFYKGERDYWRIGGALALVVDGELYLHPTEVADFITGIFFIDLAADDYEVSDFAL